jgi:hypothetical protein
MNDITRGIFEADLKKNVNLYRQNLQTEYVRRLTAIITPPDPRYDYATRAAAFSSLKKIKAMLGTAVSTNEQTRAHRLMLNYMIDKATAVK